MWFSVESRVPFADDNELTELLFSIPGAYKIHQNTLKYFLKDFKDLFICLYFNYEY